MKVLVLWENSVEEPLARNLVKVLKAIGAMLIHGRVTGTGVLLEDWKSKPQVRIDCVAGPSPAAPLPTPNNLAFSNGYSFEMEYRDGVGYTMPGTFTMSESGAGTFGMTRDFARDMVKMFPGDGSTNANGTPVKKKTKPVVPKPDTTPTGVTVRDLDIWEDEDHGHTTD